MIAVGANFFFHGISICLCVSVDNVEHIKWKNIITYHQHIAQISSCIQGSNRVFVFVCLHLWMFATHLHVSWELWMKCVLTLCFLDSVLSTWHTTRVCCQILLIGVFHWFQSGQSVQNLCPFSVCGRNKWDSMWEWAASPNFLSRLLSF